MKPCPFCGEKPIIVKRKNKMWDIGCSSLDCFAWTCTDKNCDTCVDGYVKKESAIEAWDRRKV